VKPEIAESLSNLESSALTDPEGVIEFICQPDGLNALWQVLVACHYEPDAHYWIRLEKSVHRLTNTLKAQAAAELLLEKALSVSDFTGESELLDKARTLALLMTPRIGSGD
jgi:hypothetical protein